MPNHAIRVFSGFPRASLFGILAIVVAAVTPPSLLAHMEGGEAASFTWGAMHPISGLDHVLAMVAVGIWGAQLGAPTVWALPVAFPMIMAVGGFLGLIGVRLPGIEIGIAVSAIVLGAFIAADAKLPLWASLVVVSFFAVFHGHAHGTELPDGGNAALYSVGFVIATGCLHGAGIGLGLVRRWAFGKILLRAVGALIALGGTYFLWDTLR